MQMLYKYDQYDSTVHMSEATQCYRNMKGRDTTKLTTANILHISPHHTSHHITQHKAKEENTKNKFLARVLGPDGRSSWAEFLGRMEEVLGPSSWAGKVQKSTSFFMKTPFKSIPEDRKVRELPRKMSIEEVEERKKYENYHAKPV